MPLYKTIHLQNNARLYLWKIEEDLISISKELDLNESSVNRLNNMKSESHRKGFLSIRKILQEVGFKDSDLIYDAFGKPHLRSKDKSIYEISISHSLDFSGVAINSSEVGFDIEKIKDKTLKIAPRFMNINHLNNLSGTEKIKKATVIWGIKECIFKIKNEKGISFLDHIFEDDFNYEDKITAATLKFQGKEERFKIEFNMIEDYIFVCAYKK